MSGVDPSVSSTSTLPPSDPGASAPPELPTRFEAPRGHEHDAGDLSLSVGVHGGAEVLAGTLESSNLILGSGGFLTVGGTALGALTSVAGWGFALGEMGYALATAREEGGREVLLETALGGRLDSPHGRAWGAGTAAVMLDMSDAELAATAARYTDPGVQEHFLDAVEHARSLRDTDAPGWAEAREEFRDLFRAWSDGHAAALGGWDTPGRSEVFSESRAEMAAHLEAHPDEAAVLRAHYRADVREGFLAADTNHIDGHRYELDAAYRAGVEHHARTEAEGAGALERERHDIVGVAASSFTLGSFAA